MDDWTKTMGMKEILPFATTNMDLQGIMLTEKSQTEKNTTRYHLYVKSKKAELAETE